MRRGSPRSVGSRAPRRLAALLVAALAATAAPAEARDAARAPGSDSLTLNGHASALFGIDGLGFNQSCLVDGQPRLRRRGHPCAADPARRRAGCLHAQH